MINEYNYEVLSREELERNFKLMKDNNIEVREAIILHNIKLVFYRYYKRFSNTNMNMEDIVAYGMIGLIKAVDTFRLDKKCTFTTYASKCIDNEILMYIRRESYRYVSLDELIGDDDLTLNDLIIDPSINIEGDYMDKEEIKDINGVINLLNSKDKCLFNLYFRDGYSQIEISNILGVSQSYISRRIKMLVDKLEELLYQKNIICKGGDCMGGENMTGKEIVNLIRELRAKGMSDTEILDLIEFIETHDPKEIQKPETK